MSVVNRKIAYSGCSMLLAALLMSSCASEQVAAPAPAADATATSAPEPSVATTETAPIAAEPAAPAADAATIESANPVMSVAAATQETTLDETIVVVKSCGKEPFVDYEKQAREGINSAWQDTQAGRFGYGFAGNDEYKKWKDAHKELFSAVSVSCQVLTTCADKAGRNAKEQCATEARNFAGWQRTSKDFLAKVKTMESGMAPSLCAITPEAGDLSDCYNRLAERIETACNDESCKEISQCWRGVAFLDQAIRQAESACGFVRQDLSKCRGYTEATGRREAKFQQCQSQYKSAKIEHFPVL